MHLFLNVALVLMAVFVIAWASFRLGGWFNQVALEDERALRADLEKERNELKTNLDLAVGKARAVEKFFTTLMRTFSEGVPFMPLKVLWIRLVNWMARGAKMPTMISQKRMRRIAFRRV